MNTPLYSYLNTLNYNNPVVLNGLKQEFANLISSTRSLRYIVDVKTLLKILRKRDSITIERLETILSKLDENIKYNYHGHIANIRIPAGFQIHNNPNGTLREHLDKVYDIICEDLGPKHMREMARYLQYKEGRIDELNGNRSGIESARLILLFHEENCIRDSWRRTLLEALMKARRMDIHNKVQAKLDEYCIIYPPVKNISY